MCLGRKPSLRWRPSTIKNKVRHLHYRRKASCQAYTTVNQKKGGFPGGPVVKTLPSNAGGVGVIPGQEAKIPHASQPKNQNIKNTVTNSIDFKNGPHF